MRKLISWTRVFLTEADSNLFNSKILHFQLLCRKRIFNMLQFGSELIVND